ncbi:MAG: N-6 DNA methylase [Chloroflexi bacterium]|nr:N-6 DNA methylase [Chloroflexota bacterium]
MERIDTLRQPSSPAAKAASAPLVFADLSITDDERGDHDTVVVSEAIRQGAQGRQHSGAESQEGRVVKGPPSHDVSVMQPFSNYVGSIERLARTVVSAGLGDLTAEATPVLNGGPGEALRKAVDLVTRKSTGAFFSSSDLSDELVSTLAKPINEDSRILDPACGSGDLLLACSRHLPIAASLVDTLESWGQQLYGLDLYPEFIRATRARLVLAAALRGRWNATQGLAESESWFPGIRVGDGLAIPKDLAQATHVVLNPPFNLIQTPQDVEWSSGQVSAAAVFLNHVFVACKDETNVVAILPDVLRSGTRYGRWRENISQQATVRRVSIWGTFDPWADVDVFLFEALIRSGSFETSMAAWTGPKETEVTATLSTVAKVSVGSLVPHRHSNRGRWHPYLHALGLAKWGTVKVVDLPKKRFNGTVFAPPFVVVRRTSRPGDSGRAIGTVILGDRPVAVENHLMVVKPKDATLDTCLQILDLLRSDATDRWLDHRIRCRHLTVSALNDLPWQAD